MLYWGIHPRDSGIERPPRAISFVRGKPFCSVVIDSVRSNKFIHAIIWKEKFRVKT